MDKDDLKLKRMELATLLDKLGLHETLLSLVGDVRKIGVRLKEAEADVLRQMLASSHQLHQVASDKEALRAEALRSALAGNAYHNRQASYAIRDGLDDLTNAASLIEAFGSIMQDHIFSQHQLTTKFIEDRAEALRQVDQLKARLRERSTTDLEVRLQVWKMTGGKCFYCNDPLQHPEDPQSEGKNLHVDHIVPKHLGGPDAVANYVASCAGCNVSKGTKHVVEYMISLRTLPKWAVIEGGATEAEVAA